MKVAGKDMKIFSCNANKEVATEIAKHLDITLSDMVVKTFADGEIAITINESVRGCDVFLVQSTCRPVNNNLMELLIAIEALKRASAGRITAVIPYFGYSRQDRKMGRRDAISAKLVADLITTAGADRILTMDLHAAQIQGFFNIPVDDLSGRTLLSDYFLQKFEGVDRDDLVVVASTLGSVARARKFGEKLGTTISIIDQRKPKAGQADTLNIIGDVKGKTCILVKDIVDTFGTLSVGTTALLKHAGAQEVYVCGTHGLFSYPAMQRIRESDVAEVVVLDTVAVNQEDSDKIKVLSTAKTFAKAIQRIYDDGSVSALEQE